MNHADLVGRRVKYWAAVKHNGSFNKLYAGEELIIKGIDVEKKLLVLESPTGEEWKLYPRDVKYLNNQNVKLY